MAIIQGYYKDGGELKIGLVECTEPDGVTGLCKLITKVEGIEITGDLQVDLHAIAVGEDTHVLTGFYGVRDNVAIVGLESATSTLRPVVVDDEGKLIISGDFQIEVHLDPTDDGVYLGDGVTTVDVTAGALTGALDVQLHGDDGGTQTALQTESDGTLKTKDQNATLNDGTNYLMALNAVTETKIVPTTIVIAINPIGTAIPLTAVSTIVKKFMIQADKGNTNDTYLGDSGVTSSNGQTFAPRDSGMVEAAIDENIDLNELYMDADTNGNAFRITYWS